MQASTLLQLAITGLIAALLPLSLVWASADPHKYRKLVWISAFITFDLIVFGGYTRLSDSGLGCPDWPGCYGLGSPLQASAAISAAEAAMPHGPVTLYKAWVEMIHRYLAMAIGVLITAMAALAWLQAWRRGDRSFGPWAATGLLVFVCVQGAFGALTVTMKLQPVIVTIHLLLGMGLLALLAWLGGMQDQALAPARAAGAPAPGLRALRRWALGAGLVLVLQIALGGWVSTNYATLACTDFPLCHGKLVPDMDFEHGFTLWRELGKTAAGHYLPFAALTAIHWVHRNFALVVVAVLGWTAWRAWPHPTLRPVARGLLLVLAAQVATGLATIYLNWPLAIAVLHNAGAALLVLLLTVLNYKAKYQFEMAQAAPAPSPAPSPSQAHP